MSDRWIAVGALMCAVTVGIGAFGAHWLESNIEDMYSEPSDQIDRMRSWETAARYQFFHSLGIVFIGLWLRSEANQKRSWIAILMLVGTCIFSGSLYLLVLTDLSILGAVVPIGGVLQIVAWLSFAFACLRSKSIGPNAD